MILSFKPQFKQKILNGTKIHSIRLDLHQRWQAGKEIHFATGVRTKNYDCFHLLRCQSIQKIEIEYIHKSIIDTYSYITLEGIRIKVKIDNKIIDIYQICALSGNDGFATVQDFFICFNKDFTGVIIHWTNYKY